MDFKLRILRTWRYSPNGQVMAELAAGEYRVPEDVPEKTANRAIKHGIGVRLDVVTKRVPLNKALHAAPENKSSLG